MMIEGTRSGDLTSKALIKPSKMPMQPASAERDSEVATKFFAATAPCRIAQ